MCPLCKRREYKMLFADLDMATGGIVRCTYCSHLYTKSEQKHAIDIYDNGTYQIVDKKQGLFSRIISWENERILKTILKLCPQKGSLLDFGSGKGKFAAAAAAKRWTVKCVETSPSRAAFAKATYQLDVDTEPYTNGKIFEGNFKVITLFHVLEHLEDPRTMLAELTRHNLEKDGLIVIEVPNPESWQAKIAGKKWHHWDLRHHISHFSPSQLDQLAASMGFVPVKTSFHSIHLGVLGMCDSLLKITGYDRHIIWELKTKASFPFILRLFLVLPFAVVLEFLSMLFLRGGIVRKYYRNKN